MTKTIRETFNEKIEKANNEINRVTEFLKENRNALLDYMDLKLYDVSYYCYSDDGMKKDYPLCYENNNGHDNYFSIFCDSSYESFCEWCVENACDFKDIADWINRTSKFYLTKIHDNCYDNIIANLLDACGIFAGNYYIDDLKIRIYRDYDAYETDEKADLFNELDDLIDNFYNKAIEYTANALKIYDYISDFKANQVEYFKEFLEYYESDLQDEKDAEIEREKQALETVTSIAETFKLSRDTLLTLKNNLYAYN